LLEILKIDANPDIRANFSSFESTLSGNITYIIQLSQKLGSTRIVLKTIDSWKDLFDLNEIEVVLFSQIKNLKLNEETNEETYYSEIIEYLKFYDTDLACKKLIAKAYYLIGIIKEKQHQSISFDPIGIIEEKQHEDYKNIIECFNESINFDPTYLDAKEKKGEILFTIYNDFNNALICFSETRNFIKICECHKKLVAKSPDNFKLRENKGDHMVKIGCPSKANKAYLQAISLNTDTEYRKAIDEKRKPLLPNL